MPTSFSLSNFKGFKELKSVDIKPLTVICGTNNSGKSSLIQSLLLMKQSNLENTKVPLNTYIQEPLIFNGLYAHLGSYLDVVHSHSGEKEIRFSWKVSNEVQETRFYRSEISVGIKNIELENSNNQTVVGEFLFQNFTKNFSMGIVRLSNNNYKLSFKNISLEDFLLKWIYTRYNYYYYSSYTTKIVDLVKKFSSTKFFQERCIKEVSFNDVQVKFEGVFPSKIVIKNFAKQSHNILKGIKQGLSSLTGVKIPKYLSQFLEMTINDLDTYNKKYSSRRDKSTASDDSEDVDLSLSTSKNENPFLCINKEASLLDHYASYRATVLFLRKLWSGFRYIGLIREAPKRFYLFDDLRRIDIGINGEYTPLVLAVEQETTVPKYYRCIYEGKHIKNYELREQDKLLESVNWWLSDCMKLPQIYSVAGLRGVINQVRLNSLGVEVDLPDLGFGVSQILPILVECLRTAERETIILEQPEIHLHPSLQSKLADFFICMAKSGKNLVIETHSEHLINRLCLRIAQEESNDTRNLINILFISFDEQNKTSISRLVEINKYGEIENWPVGFFDDNDSRDLLAATLKKRMSNTDTNEKVP